MAVALAGAATGALGGDASASPGVAGKRLIKPPRLKRGDVIGLVAPGGVVDDGLIERCVRNLETLGFAVKPARNLRAARGGYAGTVSERLEDLHAMARDRGVAAIWAARGGSGCLALLPHIDYATMRRHPKVLIGYSDITALHLALYRHAGLITFHGPVASSTFSDFSVAHLQAVLMEAKPQWTFHIPEAALAKAAAEPQFAPRTFRGGIAEGRLSGGNLSTLCALVGTRYAAPAKGGLLFIEEISEAPYRIDRLLTQLRYAGVLESAAGILLGVFQKCEAPPGEASLTLAQTLEDHFAKSRVPAGYGYAVGHIPQQYTLPVGARARLDADARTLTLLEAAVA